MSMSSGISECMVHGPFTAAIIGTSTASRFSMIMRPNHAFSSMVVTPSASAYALYNGFWSSVTGLPQSAL